MDKLVPDLMARLSNDATLASLQATVYGDRQPDDPSTLKTPVVVVTIAGFPEAEARHGGAVYAQFDIDVWGYATFDRAQLKKCVEVAQRIDLLMLLPLAPTNGGKTTRFVANPGWQRVDDTDPRTVHLLNSYEALYWQTQRLTARTS